MSRLFEALSKLKIQHSPVGATLPNLPRTAEASGRTIVMPVEIEDSRSAMLHPSPTSRLVALTHPDSLGSEKFRALVTRLDHLREQHEFKSLQVTSSVVNEGKSLVAANLAVTLAKYSGSKTLLIEGDLHRSTLASLFGLNELQGLSHWWSQRDLGISRFLHRLNDMPLWFLAAGDMHDQPSAILRSARLAEAFREVVARFDWIIVDSTPMLPIVDANLWSRLVDGTLLVVREGVTPVKALKKGLQALDHPKLIGVVVNEALEFDQSNFQGEYYGIAKYGEGRAKENRSPEVVL